MSFALTQSGAALLAVRDLRVAFGGREAVRGVSFAVARGETLGLVGESGSGKSVTSLAVMRLLGVGTAVSGSVRLSRFVDPTHDDETIMNGAPGFLFDPTHDDGAVTDGAPAPGASVEPGGAPCSHISESRCGAPGPSSGASDGEGVELLGLPESAMRGLRGREIAMVFQEPMTALNPVMTVGRQIGEALLAHAPKTPQTEVRARVVAAMREVGLPEPERRCGDYPHQFSGGQRQRIVIAMALMNKPRLLIADEPTTALDVTVQAQVLALLRELKERHGLGMLFISHDLAVVAQVADRVAVMRGGEIVEMGAVEQVMTRPQHAYTRALLASSPTMRTDRDRALASIWQASEGTACI